MNISVLFEDFSRHQENLQQATEIDEMVIRALRHIILDVFVHVATSFVVTISAFDPVVSWYYDILASLFSTWGSLAVQLVDVNKPGSETVTGRRFCNLVMIDSIKALIETDLAKHNANFDSNEYYFILLQTYDVLIPKQLEAITRYCWHNHWINCNIMIQTAKPEIKMFTYYPFTAEHCHRAVPTVINTFDGYNWQLPPVFPKKLNNMYQCALKVLTWRVPPFVMITETENGQLEFKGVEIMLLRDLQALLNFTVEISVLNRTIAPGMIYANGSMTGAFEVLSSRQADLGFGFLLKNADRSKVLTSIFTHVHAPLVAVIIRDNYKYSSAELLTFPFDYVVWIALLASIVVLTQSDLLLKHFMILTRLIDSRRSRNWKFYIVDMLLGMPTPNTSPFTSQRLFRLSWILGTFVLRSVYQSLLFYLFHTCLYRTMPASLEDLVVADYQLLFTPRVRNILQDVSIVSSGKLKSLTIDSASQMGLISFFEDHSDRKFAAVSAFIFFNHFTSDPIKQLHFHILPRPIIMQQATIYFTKHSYLSETFDRSIMNMDSNGLINAYMRHFAGRQYEVHNENTLIGYSHLEGLYLITFVLYVVSILIFIGEILLTKIRLH